MCFSQTPDLPDEVEEVVIEEVDPIPTVAESEAQTTEEAAKARDDERARAALAEGRSDTILTSGLGLTTEATVAPKTVLGI